MAKVLAAEGVTFLSAFPMQNLIESGAKIGIRPVICRQERTGVNIADGYARVTNGAGLGVFTMQYGPGAENAFAGVAQAYARLGADAAPGRRLAERPPGRGAHVRPGARLPFGYQVGGADPLRRRRAGDDAARPRPAQERSARTGAAGDDARRHGAGLPRRQRRLHAGEGAPLGRGERGRARPGRGPARRPQPDPGGRPGRTVRRGQRGTGGVRRAGAGAGDDHPGRQRARSRRTTRSRSVPAA